MKILFQAGEEPQAFFERRDEDIAPYLLRLRIIPLGTFAKSGRSDLL